MKSSNVSRNTFRILFYAKPINKAGKLPLTVRITVNGERAVFKTTSEASPDIWDQKRGIAIGRSNEALTNNTEIQNINAKITTIYNRMKLAEEHITAEKIKNELLGRVQSSHTLLKLFREHNEREEILFKANKRAASTYKRYLLTYRRIETYLKQVHHVTDIALSDMNYHFICGFAAFLYGNYAMERNSAIKLIQIFRKIIIEAIRNDYIRKDPFVGFSLALDSVDPAFLNEQELITIMQREFYNAPYLDLTRDMFVFSCFTGLALCDIQKSKKRNHKKLRR